MFEVTWSTVAEGDLEFASVEGAAIAAYAQKSGGFGWMISLHAGGERNSFYTYATMEDAKNGVLSALDAIRTADRIVAASRKARRSGR